MRGSPFVFKKAGENMVKLLIVRHGYSMTNKDKRYTGHMDVPLDAVGLLQGEAVSRYLAAHYAVDAIYSSDLCRAVETVRPLSEHLSMPIRKDARLREYFMGEWEGKAFSEVQTLFPKTHHTLKTEPWRVRYDGGESVSDVYHRVSECLDEIIKENEGKTVVIASHGGAIRQMLRYALRLPAERYSELPHVANASISEIVVEGDGMRVLRLSETEHLSELSENEVETR